MTYRWRAHRLKLIAVLLVATAVTSATIVVSRSLTQGREPSTRIETRSVGPSGQEGPIDVIVPNYPSNPGPAQTKGPYRLLPYGYEDPPGSAQPPQDPPCAKAEAGLNQQDLIRASNLYVTVGYVPAGFTYEPPTTDYLCGREVRDIVWRFLKRTGDAQAEISISRSRRALPLDVRVPPLDSWVTLEEGTVAGAPAIFVRSKPGQGGPQTLYIIDRGITTLILGDVADFNELVKVAESLR